MIIQTININSYNNFVPQPPLQKCFYIKKFYIIDAQMGFACGTQARRPGMKTPLQ